MDLWISLSLSLSHSHSHCTRTINTPMYTWLQCCKQQRQRWPLSTVQTLLSFHRFTHSHGLQLDRQGTAQNNNHYAQINNNLRLTRDTHTHTHTHTPAIHLYWKQVYCSTLLNSLHKQTHKIVQTIRIDKDLFLRTQDELHKPERMISR